MWGISPPVEMIKAALQEYSLITQIYIFILFLLHVFYLLMGGEVEKDRGILSKFGPGVYIISHTIKYSSLFYVACVMLFHISNDTFSNEFQLSELILLGVIMTCLAFYCIYDPLLEKGSLIFMKEKKPVKSKR